MMRNLFRLTLLILLTTMTLACGDGAWNNPYPEQESGENIRYNYFSARPKHLDPAISYSSNEIVFTGQIYEPVVQYHYLKRPYELVPLTGTGLPQVSYFDVEGKPLPDNAASAEIAYSEYLITIKPGIRYQPHPAFAKDEQGEFLYHHLDEAALEDIYTLGDFTESDTRELTAEDYVYQIKRLAHPKLHSPIFGLMSEYIDGLGEYGKQLQADYQDGAWLDLRQHDFAALKVLDRYRYTIRVKGKYPQFVYWLAMPFFTAIPWEADRFYAQPGLVDKNIVLDWYPVGTGPYMLTVNNPNRQMVIERNPNFHGENYPAEGMPEDVARGLLEDAGKPMPFIDKVVFSMEKESIPIWNKFLQGYYDASGLSSDSFDQAISFDAQGEMGLSTVMQEKGIKLISSTESSIFSMGFNMLDPVVGGDSERARLLRQAISVAVDYEEFIAIFTNGRGMPAQGPLPPGIFGYKEGEEGLNPYVYQWRNGKAERRGIELARELMVKAGYPGGRDAESGKPLILNFDVPASGSPDDKAWQNWYRKQFEKLGIQLVMRNTDYNRFLEKMRTGNAQIFRWGWNADYPDPENFLFMLYGLNSKVKSGGENPSNYSNPQFDRLFEKMKNMENGPQRQAIIDEMVEVLRYDAPWVWGMYPVSFGLYHQWFHNLKPNVMANNTLKYARLDPVLRDQRRAEWNKPMTWPLWLGLLSLVVVIAPAFIAYRLREKRVVS